MFSFFGTYENLYPKFRNPNDEPVLEILTDFFIFYALVLGIGKETLKNRALTTYQIVLKRYLSMVIEDLHNLSPL